MSNKKRKPIQKQGGECLSNIFLIQLLLLIIVPETAGAQDHSFRRTFGNPLPTIWKRAIMYSFNLVTTMNRKTKAIVTLRPSSIKATSWSSLPRHVLKKAVPVLLTPVSRRKFKEAKAQETHKEYSPLVIEVATQQNVPLIDMDTKGRELYQKLGEEQSKLLFVQLAPGEQSQLPGGESGQYALQRIRSSFDSTDCVEWNQESKNGFSRPHCKTRSEEMKSIGLLLVIISLSVAEAQTKKITVAKDGSGNYTSVQKALDAIPSGNKKPVTIFIKKGTYKERLVLDSLKDFVTLIGEDKNETILTFDNHKGTVLPNGDTVNTWTSRQFFYLCLALQSGEHHIRKQCRLYSRASSSCVYQWRSAFVFQLSLCWLSGCALSVFRAGSRQYYKDCYIEGTTDFIFGAAHGCISKLPYPQ